MMEECVNKEHENKYGNDTETNLFTMDNEIETFPDMTYPVML